MDPDPGRNSTPITVQKLASMGPKAVVVKRGEYGYLSKSDKPWSLQQLKQACIHGCLLSSFTVEGFGLDTLEKVRWQMIEERQGQYYQTISYLD